MSWADETDVISFDDSVARVASRLGDSFRGTGSEANDFHLTIQLTDISQTFILPSLPVLAIHPRLSPFPVPQLIECMLLV